MSEEKLIKPEEYYELAYRRTITIAEVWLKQISKPDYKEAKGFTFSFDPSAMYSWKESTKDGGDIFIRNSDGAIAKFTKYSHIKF